MIMLDLSMPINTRQTPASPLTSAPRSWGTCAMRRTSRPQPAAQRRCSGRRCGVKTCTWSCPSPTADPGGRSPTSCGGPSPGGLPLKRATCTSRWPARRSSLRPSRWNSKQRRGRGWQLHSSCPC